MDKKIKPFADLPQAQQRALDVILRLKKDAFYSSDVQERIETRSGGKGAGAVLGALYRNNYLKKISGGRDKLWALTDEAKRIRPELLENILEVKGYWG